MRWSPSWSGSSVHNIDTRAHTHIRAEFVDLSSSRPARAHTHSHTDEQKLRDKYAVEHFLVLSKMSKMRRIMPNLPSPHAVDGGDAEAGAAEAGDGVTWLKAEEEV